MPEEDLDDVTEIDQMTAKSVVAVHSPANRTPFLIMKSAEDVPKSESAAAFGVMQEQIDRIDQRLAKAAMPDGHVQCPTCKGKGTIRSGNMECPDCKGAGNVTEAKAKTVAKAVEALAGLHEAAASVEDTVVAKALGTWEVVAKAKYTDAQIEALGKKGHAFKNADGNYSYPIDDTDDLSNAVKAVGRGGASHNAIRKYIAGRAKAMGKSTMVPDSWGSDGSIAKALGSGNAYEILSAGMASADPSLIPGSPEWETHDAQALIDAGQKLAQLAQALSVARDRESLEVQVGNADDTTDVWDLQTAITAVQFALSIVARMAFREEVEAGVAKSISLGETQELVRFSLDVCNALKGAGGTARQTGGGSADQVAKGEVLTMDITPEELDERVAKAAGEVAAKMVADLVELDEAARREKKAEKVAKSVDEAALALVSATTDEAIAKAAQVLAEAAEAAGLTAEQTTEAIAKAKAAPLTVEQITEAVKGTPAPEITDPVAKATVDAISAVGTQVTEALGAIDERLKKVEGRPRSGGPILDGVAKSTAFIPPAPDGTVQANPELEAIAKAMEDARTPAQRENLQMEYVRTLRRQQIEGGYDSDPSHLVASAPRSS